MNVRDLSGSPLDVLATVYVYSVAGGLQATATTSGASEALFPGLGYGQYLVQVDAAGYERAQERVEVNMQGLGQIVLITLRPRGVEGARSAPPPPVVLSPKVEKKVAKGLEAVRANRLLEARQQLEEALRLAPNHPEVNFVMAQICALSNDLAQAKLYWEKTLQLAPKHAAALTALGGAYYMEGNAAAAIPLLQRAVDADSFAWRAHWLLAAAFFQQGNFAQAQSHSERALELGKENAANARLLLAKSLVSQGQNQAAIPLLEEYLRNNPPAAGAEDARHVLNLLLHPPANSATPVNGSEAEPAKLPAEAPVAASLAPPSQPIFTKWMPPDVDERVPPVQAAACKLEAVLDGVSARMQEFIRNLDRFTAKESLEDAAIDLLGRPGAVERRSFDYVVSIREIRPGILGAEEYRNGTQGLDIFPNKFATLGLPSLGLIFHPYQLDQFDMKCEGLGTWGGIPAWQVHFRQRPDKPHRIQEYRVGNNVYPVALKGRAWIGADHFQLLRLETDLVSPIPEMRLMADHQIIEYGPVHFKEKNIELWLPQSAQDYYDFRGKRTRRTHQFSDFMLFSVEGREKIVLPKVPEAGAPPDPQQPPDPLQNASVP